MSRTWASIVATVCAAILVACGGGGGDAGSSSFGTGSGSTGSGSTGSGSTGTTTGTPSITVALSNTTVTASAPVTATATLLSASGAPIAGQVVSFSTTGGLGNFSATTALTDAAGTAVVRLFPASASATGADSVVAAATVNTTAVTGKTGFQLTATNVTIASFTSDLPATASVSAYGQTNLNVTLGGVAAGTPVTVSVSSNCINAGKAKISPSTVSTTTGSASFVYVDNGCGATQSSDSVTATAGGSTATSALSLALTSPLVNSITFATATPQTIYLRGSGLNESSVVSFVVRDGAGNPLPNQLVVLEPTVLSGGLTLDGSSGTQSKRSDANGGVSVIVNAGTVPTPVRVRASVASGSATISTVSSSLAVAVGLPTESSFSLSQQTLNIEGYDIDGTANTYTIIASDRLGNPVPDGTAINFVSEGGQIQAVGLTGGNPTSGRVTVQSLSAQPRPLDGRVTVLAYALGEESFLDLNGNNVFDPGEPFQDLGNLFLSRRYSSVYNAVTDQFISLSISGSAACASVNAAQDPLRLLSLGTPAIPSVTGTCDGTWGRAYVRRAVETVYSTSSARPLWGTVKPTGLQSGCSVVALNDDANPYPDGTPVNYYAVAGSSIAGLGLKGELQFLNADRNPVRLNPMAAGTTIGVSATSGLTVSVVGGSPVPSSNSVTAAAIRYEFATGTTSGTVNLSVTSPSQLTTTFSFNLSTSPSASSCAL